MAYHVGLPWLPGGFIGVDVFFVISGFLISQLLLKEAFSEGTISIASFYARRIRRLLPALAIVLTTTLILGSFLLPDFGEKQSLAKSAMAAVLFSANQYFLTTAGGYFAGPSNLMPLLHLWSLSVEEQFYMIWPLLLILLVKLSPVQTRLQRARLLISVLLACSFAASLWLLRTHPDAAFFLLPSRAWELGVGALLATVPPSIGRPERPGIALAAGLGGGGLLAIGFLFFTGTMPFPGAAAAVPVLGSALLIFAGMACRTNVVTRLLSMKPFVTIGLLSYSWYLWHWPLLSIVRNRRVSDSNLPADVCVALFALACAAVSVRFVENPIRHHKGARVRRRPVLIAGAVTLLLLMGMATAVGARAKYGPVSKFLWMAKTEEPPLMRYCLIASANWDGNLLRKECDQVPPGAPSDSAPLTIVWGDSHADSWSPAVRVLGESEGVEVRELSRAACPPLVDASVWVGGRILAPCLSYNRAVVQFLTDLRHKDPQRKIGVVLAARWEEYTGLMPIPLRDRAPESRMLYAGPGATVAENIETLKRELRQTLTTLQGLNMRVLILLAGPEFRLAPIRCLAFGYQASACDQPTETVADHRKLAVDAVRLVGGEFPSNVRIVEPLPFFCPGANCLAFINGHSATYDDTHMSQSAAKAFAPEMKDKFRWVAAIE